MNMFGNLVFPFNDSLILFSITSFFPLYILNFYIFIDSSIKRFCIGYPVNIDIVRGFIAKAFDSNKEFGWVLFSIISKDTLGFELRKRAADKPTGPAPAIKTLIFFMMIQ